VSEHRQCAAMVTIKPGWPHEAYERPCQRPAWPGRAWCGCHDTDEHRRPFERRSVRPTMPKMNMYINEREARDLYWWFEKRGGALAFREGTA
jgi:hypothetical protein